jgi:hypothetical protein
VLAALAAAVALFYVATSPGYGLFRDELYYLACGQHLGLGYVDHPPLIGWIAALVHATLGDAPWALRLLPALAAGGCVWLVGALVAELGGGRFAQVLAGVCVGLAPVLSALFSYLSMNAFDALAWSAAWWLFARVLVRPTTRTWIVLGVVLGVGLENKISVLFLGAGLAAGLLAGRRWDLLRTRGPWLCAGLAVLLFVPHLVWQAQHGWPTAEFIHNARAHKMVALAPFDWMAEQVMMMNPFAAPLWIAGVGYLLLAGSMRRFQPLGVAFVTVLAVLIVGKGKGYYAAPAYAPVFAAGALALERLAVRGATAVRAAAVVLVVAGLAIGVPLAKPLLPVPTFLRYQAALGVAPGSSGERHDAGRLPQFFADMHGWPELVATVARVYAALPPEERAVACVFGEDYGQAGAIDVLGRAYGLPYAIAGHNSYWLWGPRGCTGQVIIVIGGNLDELQRQFERAELAATHVCKDDLCMPYENHKPIHVARGLRVPLATVWPRVKHYD